MDTLTISWTKIKLKGKSAKLFGTVCKLTGFKDPKTCRGRGNLLKRYRYPGTQKPLIFINP